ncbi:MAG: efflux RND transporter periplasmic adaptor subunit, partial [Pseudomonadota bacterium]
TAEAELADARAALGQAQLDLGFTTVRAPFPGRVSDRRVDIGNLIDTQTVLTTLVRTDPIEFEFEVTEDVLLAYRRAIADGTLPPLDREGSGAAVRLVDEADWPRPVTIRFVDNVVDVGSGTIRVQAVARNEDGLVLPGQFGTIRIPGSPEYEALLVPESAILSDQAQKILMTVDENGIVVPKPVRVGPREFGLRIIRAGLEPDDRIIVNGLLRARPGAPVNAEPGVIERWPGGAPGVLSN